MSGSGNSISMPKAIKYFELAEHQANIFSKDPSTKVGAIFLAPYSHQILSLGYNGFPRGINENNMSRWERPIKYKWTEHAERNGIYNACRHGTPLENSIAIITMFPCADCARALIQSGIKTVVSKRPDMQNDRWKSEFEISLEMLAEAGIQVMYVD